MKTEEQISFDENINSLIKDLQGQVLKKIVYFLDLNPTFELDKIPFSFKYAHFVILHTNVSCYYLGTAQTSTGIDTLWRGDANSIAKTRKPDATMDLNEHIQKIDAERGLANYYYKLTLITDTNTWTFISADIYDNIDSNVDLKINDEMLLVFSDKQELEKFERL